MQSSVLARAGSRFPNRQDLAAFYHGAAVRDRSRRVQALTLRIPEEEYQLLRALAFSSGTTINQVALVAIRRLLDTGNTRQVLQSILDEAKEAAGKGIVPRNPHGRGPKRPSAQP